jgi:hypothetical protein
MENFQKKFKLMEMGTGKTMTLQLHFIIQLKVSKVIRES